MKKGVHRYTYDLGVIFGDLCDKIFLNCIGLTMSVLTKPSEIWKSKESSGSKEEKQNFYFTPRKLHHVDIFCHFKVTFEVEMKEDDRFCDVNV